MKKRFCLLLILIFTVSTLILINLVSASIPKPSVPEFTFAARPIQLSEDNTITATFLIDYKWFRFRLVYNQTTETYSVYSLGELIVGQSSLKDKGELVAENMQGPLVSADGKYDPLEINSWFETKTIDKVSIVYYDGIEVLTVFSENLPSEAIKVLSPENKTYNTPDVPLEYITNRIFYTTTYSLDGQGNQTINGNIILSGLTEGPHRIIIYIESTPENITASKTIRFTITLPNNEPKNSPPQTKSSNQTDSELTSIKTETPDRYGEVIKTTDTKPQAQTTTPTPTPTLEPNSIPEPQPAPFPTTLVIASISIMVIVSLGYLVYFK